MQPVNDGTDLILYAGESAAWKARAIAAAAQVGETEVAEAVRRGGAEVAVRTMMRSLSPQRTARIWAALLGSTAAGPLPDLLTMITHSGWRPAAYPLPSFTASAAADPTYVERLSVVREEIRAEARARGRLRALRIGEYLADICSAVLLSERDVMRYAFTTGNGPVVRVLADAIVVGACQAAACDETALRRDIVEAFVLAASGYAPMAHESGSWQVRQVFA